MRQLAVCALALSAALISGCASNTSSMPAAPDSPMNAPQGMNAPQAISAPQEDLPQAVNIPEDAMAFASPAPGTAPLHIHGSMAWYQGENLNKDLSGTWMAQHYDITEQGDAGGAFANAFMGAGGKYAIDYSDPEIIPFCRSPFATVNGAKPGTCTGPLSSSLNPVESAWLHDSKGNRLHVISNGTQLQGNWQDRVNPNYASLPSIYRTWESSLLPGTRWNAFEIDDFNSAYIPSYFLFKFGATAREYDALGANANPTWFAAQARIVAAAPKPVFLNGGILGYNASQMISQANALGLMLESCASTTNTTGIVGTVWVNNMNDLLLVQSLHKLAVCINYGTTLSLSTTERLYGLASWWLVYNPTYSVNMIDVPTADGHETYPEHGIALYNPITSATTNIATLKTSSGVYLREFQFCYVNKVAIGACATEVNADTVTHTLPPTHFKYGHFLVLSTKSWSSGGTVTWAAGTATTLAGGRARILKI